METLQFVVTGCSRSGTEYSAKLFSRLGLRCGHEKLFGIHRVKNRAFEAINWEPRKGRKGESSFLAAPFLSCLPSETVVLHQVRNPLSVIRSHMGLRFFAVPHIPSAHLAANHEDFTHYISEHCPTIAQGTDELHRCMRYWVSWNRLVQRTNRERVRYLRYQIEQLNCELLEEILDILDVEMESSRVASALSEVSRKTNSRPRDESISWETLPEGRDEEAVRELAVEYGYAVGGL